MVPPGRQIHARGYLVEPPMNTTPSLLTPDESGRLFVAVPTKSDYRDALHRPLLRLSCRCEGQQSTASGGVLTRIAPGSKESRLWPEKAVPHMRRVLSRHRAPRFARQDESHVGVLALGGTLPARARCRGPVPLPISFFIGRFAPRRLSLPSTPDGSPPPFFRWSLCSPAC